MLSLTDRQHRLLSAVLVLGTLVLAMVAVNLAASVFFAEAHGVALAVPQSARGDSRAQQFRGDDHAVCRR